VPGVLDFEVRQAPALVAHLAGENAEAFGLEFAGVVGPDARIGDAVGGRGKDDALAVHIGADEEDSAADGVDRHEISLVAQVAEVEPTMIAPGVLVERRPAVFQDAIGVGDVGAGGEEAFDDVGGVVDDVDVQPEHPVLVVERYDIVVDFSQFQPGTKLYFVNTLEHQTGAGPKGAIPLADILSGKYQGDPAVGKFMEFRVKAYTGTDLSMNPADYAEGKKKMIPRNTPTASEIANARRRSFEFGRSGGTDDAPWTIKVDGGSGNSADAHRVSAAPEVGSVEVWTIQNTSGGWSHPVHVHFEEGQILSKDGAAPPLWEKWARKDVYRVGPEVNSAKTIQVAIRFREFLGSYVEHCHNTQHEDHAMLLRWDINRPGQAIAIPTPEGGWEGMFYEPSYVLPTWRTGIVAAP